jgi:hypothetical protein
MLKQFQSQGYLSMEIIYEYSRPTQNLQDDIVDEFTVLASVKHNLFPKERIPSQSQRSALSIFEVRRM